MNITQIDYFIIVAECLSFTKASEMVYISQPNISKQIANLEKELGFKLFYRTKQYVRLTEAGKILYNELKDVLLSLKRAIKHAKSISNNTGHQINIGISNFIDNTIFNKVIKSLKDNCPKSIVFVESIDFYLLRSNLINGFYDAVISYDFVFSGINNINMKTVSSHSMVLTFSKSHPLAKKNNLTVADFRDEIFLMMDATPEGTKRVIDVCRKYGFAPKTEMHNSLSSIFLNIELGHGVAIFDTAIRPFPNTNESFLFVKIPAEIAMDNIVLAWLNNNHNPLIPMLLDELLKNN